MNTPSHPFPLIDSPSWEKPYSVYPLSASTNMLLPLSSHPLDDATKSAQLHEDPKALAFHCSVSETANEKMRHLQQDYEVRPLSLPLSLMGLLRICWSPNSLTKDCITRSSLLRILSIYWNLDITSLLLIVSS
jgi:hypothetical protein